MKTIREEEKQIVACPACGAEARWSDNPRGDDYYSLPCGHRETPTWLTRETRVIDRRAAPSKPPQICVCLPHESFCGAWDCRHPSPHEQAAAFARAFRKPTYGPECRKLRGGDTSHGPLCSCPSNACVLEIR